MKFYKKKVFWIIFTIILVVLYFSFRSQDEENNYTTEEALRGSLSQTVSSTGDLTDSREIILNFEIGGRIGKIYVDEGQGVAAGDLIATIDEPVLSTQVEQAKASLNLAIAKAGANDDLIREADIAVENAEDYLEDTEDLNENNISAADQAKEDAQDYLMAAQSYYNQVVEDNGVESATAKSALLTLRSAEKNYNSAQKAEEVADRQADLAETSAENSLSTAKARLKSLESNYTRNSNDASVASARASYMIALENLKKTSLRSPVNGVVTSINNKVGEILGTGVIKESFTKVLANDFIIESNIPESDIVKVSLGDAAEVTFDALNMDDVFEAEVVQIDTDATIIQDVVYYEVKLRINEVDRRLKPGMSANIDIATASKDNAVMVPRRAIKSENGKYYVEILKEENKVEKISVQTGLEGDDGMIEVASGLQGGEDVITFIEE